MIAIDILLVGKLKRDFKYLQVGVDDYKTRLRAVANLRMVEVADESITPSITEAQVMEREGKRLLGRIAEPDYVIALSEHGKTYTSTQFSAAMDTWCTELFQGNQSNGGASKAGRRAMMFVVGGPLGLSSEVLKRANQVVSLSAMTFPHPMVRLILIEQLYRSFRISRGEPYHK